jgi:PAS domain S-box-containing protein
MTKARWQGLKRFYIFTSLGILLTLALAISAVFLNSARTATQKHYEELRAEVDRSKREFIRNAIERTIQVIELERTRCAFGEDPGCDENAVKARLHEYIGAIRLKDDGYIWVNAVRNYAGGDGYAYRFVHPNLPETEGTSLSTHMQDIKGNFPYLTELEGVNKEGEVFFDYWFKKMGSDVIQHKLTFAKLYKPYDWIIATGVYLDDVDMLVQSEMERWEKYSRQNVWLAVAFTGFAIFFAWLCYLLVGKKLESVNAYFWNEVEQREKALQQFNLELEAKVVSRTREIAVSEEKYVDLYENSPDMYVSAAVASGLIEGCNQTLCTVLGYSREELLGQSVEELYHPDCLTKIRQTFNDFVATGQVHDRELVVRKKDGTKLDVSLSVTAVQDASGAICSSRSTLRDITERKHNDAINASRLHLMQFAANHSMGELLEEALNQAEDLTDSRIGFYHLVDEDQQNLRLQAWSTRTNAEFCRAEGMDMHYPIAKAGIWVDCVHEGKPVIHNDYAALPHRKGIPAGHPAVVRELVAPVLRRGKIKAILGVGNRPSDYRDRDVESILLLIDLIWEIVERKQVDDERERLNQELDRRVSERTAELAAKNAELERANRLFVGRELRMIELKEQLQRQGKNNLGGQYEKTDA